MRSLACVLALLALASGGDAACDEDVVKKIREKNPDVAALTAQLQKIDGDYEIRALHFGVNTADQMSHCIKMKFTTKGGTKTLEFEGFDTPKYEFTINEGKLVYAGKRSEGNQEGIEGKEAGEASKNSKKKQGKTPENVQKADEKKRVDTGKEGTSKKGKGNEEDGSQKDVTITYHVIQRTDNIIALYTCSDIPEEPPLAFIAVASKSIQNKEEVESDVKDAMKSLKNVGIEGLKKLPFCKDKPKRKRNKEGNKHSHHGKEHDKSKQHTPKEKTGKPDADKHGKGGEKQGKEGKSKEGSKDRIKKSKPSENGIEGKKKGGVENEKKVQSEEKNTKKPAGEKPKPKDMKEQNKPKGTTKSGEEKKPEVKPLKSS